MFNSVINESDPVYMAGLQSDTNYSVEHQLDNRVGKPGRTFLTKEAYL